MGDNLQEPSKEELDSIKKEFSEYDDSTPPVVNPEELEQKMLEKQQDVAVEEKHNPEDIAAAFFKQNYPRIKMLMSKMSKRQLERVILCAASYPLVPENLKLKDKEEKQCAWVLEQMVACKTMMLEATKLNKLNNIEELEKQNNLSLEKGVNENVTRQETQN